MNLLRKSILLFYLVLLSSCANYERDTSKAKIEKKFYSSTGFALIYEDTLYKSGVISKNINSEGEYLMHSLLKRNTPVKIINPENSKVFESKVSKTADYPKIFNVIITNKIASLLELDLKNPYVEVIEIKKNKTFIAKESNTFDEEKNVAGKAPVDEIKMDVLLNEPTEDKSKTKKKLSYFLLISDFYYLKSADSLKNELINATQIKKFSIKKIKDNKYRLSVGPFENFNSLKSTYISLNNLGFEDLNIYKE